MAIWGLATLFAAAAAAAAPPAGKAPPQVSVSGGERTTVHYACKGGEALTVTYVNGDPDHLAIVPVKGGGRIFVNVIAASGARYASGQYVWWTKGREASLYDVMHGPNAAPVLACREHGL